MPTSIHPVTRSKTAAKASYDRLSRWYDFLAASEKPYRDLGLQKLNARPGECVLEIGFGTGGCLVSLAQAVGLKGKVWGIDLSEGMLCMAQQRLRAAGLSDRCDLRVGDAAQLPFGAESFDGVFMSFTLELFDTPEIPLVLGQSYRVLRSGGRIVVVTLVKQDCWPVHLYEWFHDRWPAAVDCRPIYAQPALRDAGFHIRDVSVRRMWGLPVEIILASR